MPLEVKGIDKENSTLTMIASTQGVDRHGDTVMQSGWDLKPFIKNPVILNSHKHNDATEVIARAENIRIEGKGKRAKLIMDWVFAVDENPKAQIIFDLYAGKFLHASSVGFIVRKFAEKPDGSRDWFVIEEAELLEVSAVSVPANAMALAKAKGIDTDALDEEDVEEEEEVEETETEKETTEEETETEEPEEEENQEDDIDEENQEPEVSETPEEKGIRLRKELAEHDAEHAVEEPAQTVKIVSHNSKVLKAIHTMEDDRMTALKAARGTIDMLLSENGLKNLDEETKEKVHKRKVNQVIRKLMKAK